MPKYTKAEIEEARAELAESLNPKGVRREHNAAGDLRWCGSDGISIGDYDLRAELPTVYFVIPSVARSGMSRTMRVYVDGPDGLRYVTGYVAKVLGWALKYGGQDAIVVKGCGMDMTFHLLDCVCGAVFGCGPSALNANHFRREVL